MREHDRLTIDPERVLLDVQRQWATDHAAKAGNFMRVADRPEGLSGLRLAHHLEGTPIPYQSANEITDLAPAPTEQMREQLMDNEVAKARVAMARELLLAGESVVLITNHTDLPDIAYAQSLVVGEIGRQQDQTRRQAEFKRGVIINGMVNELEFRLGKQYLNGIDALKMLETDIYLSFPRTSSTEERIKALDLSDSDGEAVYKRLARHNKKMREAVGTDLYRGGMLLAAAASGTTDEVRHIEATDEQPAHKVIQMSKAVDKIRSHKFR